MINQDKHIIFVDTSVFESENFFYGRKLNQLCGLAKNKQIEVKITDIIYNEIIQRINSNILNAQKAYKKANSIIHGQGKILRNISEFKSFYPLPLVDIDNLKSHLKSQLDLFIKDNLIEIVNSNISDINEVFQNYFETKAPFKEGKKKNEFPDAFTFNTISKWSQLNNKKVFFISNDSDFNEISNDAVDCSYKLTTILGLISGEIDEKHTEFVQYIYENSYVEIIQSLENDFEHEIIEEVYNNILNDPFYDEPEVETPIDIKAEIDIGVINEIILNSSFSYEIESNITFSIDLQFTNFTSAVYDKEDRVWLGEERLNITKQYSANVISVAEFSYDLLDENGFFHKMSDFRIRDLEEIYNV